MEKEMHMNILHKLSTVPILLTINFNGSTLPTENESLTLSHTKDLDGIFR